MITNIHERKTPINGNSEKNSIRYNEGEEESTKSEKALELPSIINNEKVIIKQNKENNSQIDLDRYEIKNSIDNLSKKNVKNFVEIRDHNRTINRVVSISQKSLDLKNILDKEKLDEIEKFNLIEKLIRVNYNNNYYEQMFENDPLEINDLELIKNRNQVKIRNKKLTMDNVLSNSYKDPKNYIVRNIKKPTNIYDFNYKLKVTLLEKDVEMQKKFMKDSSPYKKKTNNSNNKNITILDVFGTERYPLSGQGPGQITRPLCTMIKSGSI